MNAMTDDVLPLVSYTLFPDVWPKTKLLRADVLWSDLVAKIKDAATYIRKADCPLISMADYGDTIDDTHKCLRYAENVVRIYGVEVDYDGEKISIEEAAAMLDNAGLLAVLYTSPSHTPQKPRWRVLMPLSEPCFPEKRSEYVGKANRALGGIASKESFTLSQSFYIGRVKGSAYEVRETFGRCVDSAYDVEPLYFAGQAPTTVAKDSTTDAELRAAFDRGEDRYQAMLKLSSRWAARGMGIDDIENNLLTMLGTGSQNGDGIDLKTRARPMAESAVRKFGETRAKPAGNMLVTRTAPEEFNQDPNEQLVDLAAMNGKDICDEDDAHELQYATAPFDADGNLLRFYPGGVSIWSGFPGAGKCLGIDTPVLMFDGSVKRVQDVAVGDQLMGPDSFPRRVLSLARGREMLYRVTPVKGDPYVVNESHILSLKQTSKRSDAVVNISVLDYLKKGKPTQEKLKGWRTGVDFRYQPVPLSPYFLGVWLGDGSIHGPIVYKPDEEILAECEVVAAAHALRAVRFTSNTCPAIRISGSKGTTNPVYAKLTELGVNAKKHVPLCYRANSRKIRLEVLAGLLDTDGSLSRNGFDFISVEPQLAADVAYLARSVGLAAYVSSCTKGCQTGFIGEYHRVSISGDCSMIPLRIKRKQAVTRRQIKRVTVTGISVDPIGIGDYYGFEITGDRLFMLGDFTVTHNTTLLRQFICHTLYRGSSVFLASLEEDPRRIIRRLASTAAGVKKANHHQVQWFIDAYAARFRLWGVIGLAEHLKLLGVARKLASEGIRHVVIDSLMCLDINNGDFEAQRQFAVLLATTARASQIHIHLVAHPRKLVKSDQELDLNDVAGARELGGVADNVIFIRRDPNRQAYSKDSGITPMCISIRKQRNYDGALGDCEGWFHRDMRQYNIDQFAQAPKRYLPDDAYAMVQS